MLKKLLALALAGAMVIGSMSMGAFAADPAERTLTISGLQVGDKVTFYKVLSWADDTAEATRTHAVNGWYWEAPFSAQFASGDDWGSAKLSNAVNSNNQLEITDALANDIARAINEGNATNVGVETVQDGESAVTLSFTNDDTTDKDGLYVAIITPARQDVVYNPVFVHLDSSTDADSYAPTSSADYSNKGAAKKSTIPLEKESHNPEDYTDTLDASDDPVDDGDTTKPGDILNFKVTTAIPGYGATFDDPYYIVKDQMNGLALDPSTIEVKVAGTVVNEGADTYTKTADANGYKIEFAEAYLKGLKVATELTIEYDATVKAGANTNVIKEKNTVTLEYSHDPSTEDGEHPGGRKKYEKDITNHYTFSIDANNLVGPYEERIGESGSEIIKIAVDKDGNPITSEKTWSNVSTTKYAPSPLKGAEFKLYGAKKDDNGNIVIDESTVIGTATSDASGRLNFTGLDAGTYFLKEEKAPAGYVKQSDPVKITINATLVEREITEYYDQQGNWYTEKGTAADDRTEYKYKTDELQSYSITYGDGANASSYTFKHAHESSDEIKWSIATSSELPQSIHNAQGVELPSTGGVGTTIFYAGGAMLVLFAGVLLVSKRRIA